MKKKPFFEKCDVWWWNGYYIEVRNPLNHALEKRHLTNEEKEIYEKEFGEKIITKPEFEDWIIEINASDES